VIEDDALMRIIADYTREAGVRSAERQIGTIARKVAREVAEGRRRKVVVRAKDVPTYLGPVPFRREVIEEGDEAGVVTGMAWTPVGGDVLFVEASSTPGRGHLTLTGQLGDVMQESARAALTYVRSIAADLGLPPDFYEKTDFHVHVPAGSIPKDGPSAGVTMATALISALTGRVVDKGVAMTGEITLRGRVLPIGGVKDKVLAAHRAGVRTVIIPRENEQDLREIPDDVRNDLRFVFADHMRDIIPVAMPEGGPAARSRSRDRKAS
jgi:ATP-dependent Lon protease